MISANGRRNKRMGRAGRRGQPGQLAPRSRGACPTNRPVCFHSFAGNVCRAGPAEPESERRAKIPAARCLTCAARYAGRKTHSALSKQPRPLRPPPRPASRSPGPGCRGTRAGFYLRVRERLCDSRAPGPSPGEAGSTWRGSCQTHEIRFPQPSA